MSHVVECPVKMPNVDILQDVCRKLGIPVRLAEVGQKIYENLYGTKAEGVASFTLPGWNYPVVVASDGTVKYDNYGGQWGDQSKIDEVSRNYSHDFVIHTLESEGHRVLEDVTLADGSIHLVMGE